MTKKAVRTLAEQETTFRFDEEERVLWAGTTTPRVAARWRRARFPVTVLSRDRDGAACSWEVKLPWRGNTRPWSRLFRLGMSRWMPNAASVAPSRAEDDPQVGGET
jgi:hypothetical protein